MRDQSQGTSTSSTDELSSKHNKNGTLDRSLDDAHPRDESKTERQQSFLFVENIRKVELRPESPENGSLHPYFKSIVNVSPTRTDVQGLIVLPAESSTVMTETRVQESRAQADEPEQCLQTVDSSAAKDDSRSQLKRKHLSSRSSSSSTCSENDEGLGLPPLISRDLWTSTGPRKSPEPRSRAEKHAHNKSARSQNAKYKRFMKEVFPEIMKGNNPWAWSRLPAAPSSSKLLQTYRSPSTSPLVKATEARFGSHGAHCEGAAVEKKSFWSAPIPLNPQRSETDKNAGPADRVVFNGTGTLKYRIGLRKKGARAAKRLKKSRHDAVLAEVGKERPAWRETVKSLRAAERPCETQRSESCMSKTSSVRDSPIETFKPRSNFWLSPGRYSSKTTRCGEGLMSALKFDKEGTLPKLPEARTELSNKIGGEKDEDAWIGSLWRQKQDALVCTAAAKSTKAASTIRQSHEISELPVLDRHSKEPSKPLKETKDSTAQTSVQHETKDAVAQTSFICMVGKSFKVDMESREHLRQGFLALEEQVEFMDMPLGQAGGVSGITFGHYFCTHAGALGIMRLSPNSEKPLAVNNDSDMWLYALESGVNITTIGATWLVLPKRAAFYICRGLPYTLRNLGLTTCSILYILTEGWKPN